MYQKSINKIKAYFNNHDKFIFIGFYEKINKKTNVLLKCKRCSYENTYALYSVKSGTGCGKCAQNNQKLSQDCVNEIVKNANILFFG